MSKLSDECYERLMAESVDQETAERLGAQYVAEGYASTSSRYRCIARLPQGETALEALQRVAPAEARRLLERIEQQAADTYRRMYAERDGNQLTLDLRTWKEFRAKGGQASW